MADINPAEVVLDNQAAPSAPAEIPADQVKLDAAPDIDPNAVVLDKPHSSLSGEAATAVEGLARGLTGGLSDVAMRGARSLAEKYSDDPDFWAPKMSDVAERQDANPGISHGSELAGVALGLTKGMGAPGFIKGFASGLAPEAVTTLGKIGSAAITSAIESSMLQGGDEISKAMLGKGDPEAPVASALINMGAAGLFGGLIGGASQTASSGLKAIGNAKAGTSANSFLAGVGNASNPKIQTNLVSLTELGLDPKAFENGQAFFNKGLPKFIDKASNVGASAVAGTVVGAHTGLVGGLAAYQVAHELLDKYIQKLIGKPITAAAQKYGVPAIVRALGAGKTTGLWDLLDHAAEVNGGAQKATRAIEQLFKAGSQQSINTMSTDRERTKLKQYIEDGGVDQQMQEQINQNAQQPQGFAEGGDVTAPSANAMAPILQGTDALAEHYPEQNMLMQAAKGRVSNYLNSLRPLPNPAKLAFDDEMPNKEKERSYNKAVDIALKPLSVLNHIKEGTLEPEHVAHLNAMYPEVHNYLQKQITDRITKAQLKGEKPSYKVRQGLSMFMNVPLSGELTPSAIQAAQSVYNPGSPPAAPTNAPAKGRNKKNTSSLTKVADQYRTADQAAQTRQNAGH